MATEISIERRAHPPLSVSFEDDEEWELKDTERMVLVLGPNRVVRAAVNLQDFVSAVVTEDGDAG